MIFVIVCSTWGIIELKTRFDTWITRNDVNGAYLFHLSYLITLMAYLCSQSTPKVQIKYFVWLVDLQSILPKWRVETWFSTNGDIRKCLLYMKNSWTKKCFETWIRKHVNGVCLFDLLFNNTYDLPVLITNTKYPNQVFCVWLVDLQTICTKYRLETWFSPNDDIRKCFLDMTHGSTKNVFCNVNNTKWRKWCEFVSPFLFNITYGLPVLTMDTKCPNELF
jgi:hypothetical protein